MLSNRLLVGIGACVFIITALLSTGYHHPDEHFQILEFAGYILGEVEPSELPWEFESRIRPSLQPYLAAGAIGTMEALGLENPFHQATILRLMMAGVSLLLILQLYRKTVNQLDVTTRKLFLILALFLWFSPYFQVRFSSENLGGICLLGAILMCYPTIGQTRWHRFLIAGALMGLSFWFRFQMAFAIAGVIIWLVLMAKERWTSLTLIVIGMGVSGTAGILLDQQFYGELEFTPWNYYVSNIVEGKASTFGVEPWWAYFTMFSERSLYPIGIVLLIFFSIGLYREWKSIYAFALIPFLIAHMMVDHKEMRFLAPMLLPFLILVSSGFTWAREHWKWSKAIRITIGSLVVLNVALLTFRSSTPAQSAVESMSVLYDESEEGPVHCFGLEESTMSLAALPIHYYRHENYDETVLGSLSELQTALDTMGGETVLLASKDPKLDLDLPGYSVSRIHSSIPEWVLSNNAFDWQSRAQIMMIYRIERIRPD